MRHILFILTLLACSLKSFGNWKGNFKVIDSTNTFTIVDITTKYDTILKSSKEKFEINSPTQVDTISFTPSINYLATKIVLPNNQSINNLDDIPIFKNPIELGKIINFTTKKASKKYFKDLKKKNESNLKKLKSKIDSYQYFFNGKVYSPTLKVEGNYYFICINLN